MPDPYYDEIVLIALSLPGVRVALRPPHPYGLCFETDRDPVEVATELREQFQDRAWRVQREAHHGRQASMRVLSEIDRGINVFLTQVEDQEPIGGRPRSTG